MPWREGEKIYYILCFKTEEYFSKLKRLWKHLYVTMSCTLPKKKN